MGAPLPKLQCSLQIKYKEPLKQNYTLVVYLWTYKNTVDHSILLAKLEHYGIRGITNEWFRSYLSNRQQFVSINNSDSSTLHITCGVPQGSVLGPLLFLIYIDDFINSSSIFDFHLFADDSNLSYSNKDLQHFGETINQELGEINTWLCANKLSLNLDKTHFVVFHPYKKKLNYRSYLPISRPWL